MQEEHANYVVERDAMEEQEAALEKWIMEDECITEMYARMHDDAEATDGIIGEGEEEVDALEDDFMGAKEEAEPGALGNAVSHEEGFLTQVDY